MKKLLSELDLRDGFFFGGLALAAAGGWMISPAYALIGVGVVLIWLSMRGAT